SGHGNGITITGTNTANNTIRADRIGTSRDGTAALPNAGDGILVAGGATNNTIGFSLIAGNALAGVVISGAGTSGNMLMGDVIGLDAARTAALPNLGGGVV